MDRTALGARIVILNEAVCVRGWNVADGYLLAVVPIVIEHVCPIRHFRQLGGVDLLRRTAEAGAADGDRLHVAVNLRAGGCDLVCSNQPIGAKYMALYVDRVP